MTVPFFYNYKDELIKKLKEDYSDAISEKHREESELRQMEELEKFIVEYFGEMKSGLSEVIEASKGDISFERHDEREVVRITISKNYLTMTKKDKKMIEVEVGNYIPEVNIVESSILGYIVPGDKKPVVKKIGNIHEGGHFDENTINFYMRTAFKSILKESTTGKL